jgi:hypothetical protein
MSHLRNPPEPRTRTIPNPVPPFFVPHAADPAQAEQVWLATVTFLTGQGFAINAEERIYALSYVHNGQACVDVIGEADRYTQETVLVILRTQPPGPTLVCTANRGVLRGQPIFAPGDAFAVRFRQEPSPASP